VNQHIVVPNVSGCAAIKCSVISGYDKQGNDNVTQSFTLHSDGLYASKQSASQIGNAINEKSGENISVSILMITNGHDYFLPASEHRDVLNIIKRKLEEKNISYNYKAEVVNGAQSMIDITMSGTDEEICTHYEQDFRPKPTSEQLKMNREGYAEYITKYNTEAGDRKMNRSKLPHGRGLPRDNPDFFKPLDRQQWLSFVNKEQIEHEFARLDNALQNYDNNRCGCRGYK